VDADDFAHAASGLQCSACTWTLFSVYRGVAPKDFVLTFSRPIYAVYGSHV
jgi:hypothetical protein